LSEAAVEMKDWQHGIPLPLLKEFGAIFKAAHGPHVYGAFGLVKERDIAEAISECRFCVRPNAAAIYRRLKVTSQQETYHETKITIPAGDAIISAFACTNPEDGTALLTDLTNMLRVPEQTAGALWQGPPASVWLEIFEEDYTAKTIATEMGFQYVDTKIMAGSEIKGVYVLGRAVQPFNDPAEFQTLAVLQPDFLSEDDLAAIAWELADYGDKWAQHYSTYNKGKAWTAFALQGYDANDPSFIIQPNEMARKWKAENPARLEAQSVPTIAAAYFPKTLAIAARIPNAGFDRIRFMRLAPGGGELARHADLCPEAGVKDGRLARIHIPIVTNPEVLFTQWHSRGGQVTHHFPQGAMCYIDQRQPHKAVNGGTTDRIHFVLDTKCTPALRKLISEGK
jgi:hypothetical protein